MSKLFEPESSACRSGAAAALAGLRGPAARTAIDWISVPTTGPDLPASLGTRAGFPYAGVMPEFETPSAVPIETDQRVHRTIKRLWEKLCEGHASGQRRATIRSAPASQGELTEMSSPALIPR